MKPIGPVREKAKAHSTTNKSLTCRRSPRKSNMKMTLVQAKYVSKGPRMGYERTHCPRSLRNNSTQGCLSCPPAPLSKTPWKTSEKCKQRREEISVEGNHHLHIKCFAPTKLAAFMRKRHLNNDSIAHNTLYHLQKGPNGTNIQTIPLRRVGGGLRCNRKYYIRK